MLDTARIRYNKENHNLLQNYGVLQRRMILRRAKVQEYKIQQLKYLSIDNILSADLLS